MRKHSTDPVALIAGLAFLGAAGLWLLTHLVAMSVPTVGVLIVGGLVLLGGLGLAYTIAAARRPR